MLKHCSPSILSLHRVGSLIHAASGVVGASDEFEVNNTKCIDNLHHNYPFHHRDDSQYSSLPSGEEDDFEEDDDENENSVDSVDLSSSSHSRHLQGCSSSTSNIILKRNDSDSIQISNSTTSIYIYPHYDSHSSFDHQKQHEAKNAFRSDSNSKSSKRRSVPPNSTFTRRLTRNFTRNKSNTISKASNFVHSTTTASSSSMNQFSMSTIKEKHNMSASTIRTDDSPQMTAVPAKYPIKIYARCLRSDIEYKTLSVGRDTTCKEVVNILLSKYKMGHRDANLFYITLDIVSSQRGVSPTHHQPSFMRQNAGQLSTRSLNKSTTSLLELTSNDASTTKSLVLDDESKPIQIDQCTPWDGQLCRFTLRMRSGALVRIYDSFLMAECQYKSLFLSESTTVEEVIKIQLNCYESLLQKKRKSEDDENGVHNSQRSSDKEKYTPDMFCICEQTVMNRGQRQMRMTHEAMTDSSIQSVATKGFLSTKTQIGKSNLKIKTTNGNTDMKLQNKSKFGDCSDDVEEEEVIRERVLNESDCLVQIQSEWPSSTMMTSYQRLGGSLGKHSYLANNSMPSSMFSYDMQKKFVLKLREEVISGKRSSVNVHRDDVNDNEVVRMVDGFGQMKLKRHSSTISLTSSSDSGIKISPNPTPIPVSISCGNKFSNNTCNTEQKQKCGHGRKLPPLPVKMSQQQTRSNNNPNQQFIPTINKKRNGHNGLYAKKSEKQRLGVGGGENRRMNQYDHDGSCSQHHHAKTASSISDDFQVKKENQHCQCCHHHHSAATRFIDNHEVITTCPPLRDSSPSQFHPTLHPISNSYSSGRFEGGSSSVSNLHPGSIFCKDSSSVIFNKRVGIGEICCCEKHENEMKRRSRRRRRSLTNLSRIMLDQTTLNSSPQPTRYIDDDGHNIVETFFFI